MDIEKTLQEQQEHILVSKANILAVLCGLAILYAGSGLLLYFFIDSFMQQEIPDTNFNLVTLAFLAVLYGLSGWIVVRLVRIKAWSLGIVPSLFVLLYVSIIAITRQEISLPAENVLDWFALPYTITGLTYPLIGREIIIVLVICALIGGLVAKYVKLK